MTDATIRDWDGAEISVDWDARLKCARCSAKMTPRDAEHRDIRECPKCGLPDHPAYDALDALCGDAADA
jgi:Zn finger protein HypA/HybF involved in hydrogenase expression